MAGKRWALFVSLVLFSQAVLASQGQAWESNSPLIGGRGGKASKAETVQIPEGYGPVLEAYSEALYADWYLELTEERLVEMGLCPLLADIPAGEEDLFGYCLRDVNGDGVPELFLGLQNPNYVETVYQMFTLTEGELSLVFTADEADSLYLLTDGALLLTGFLEGEESYDLVYLLDAEGSVTMAGGVFYDIAEEAYYALLENMDPEDGLAITEEAYYAQLEDYELKREYLTYTSLAQWNREAGNGKTETAAEEAAEETSEEAAGKAEPKKSSKKKSKKKTAGKTSQDTAESAPEEGALGNGKEAENGAAMNNTGVYYSHQVAADYATGIPTARVLVPEGWRMNLSVNWSNVSTDSPGVATLTMDSPDGRARITMVSNQAFCDMSTGGFRYGEGVIAQIYNTNLYYRNAEALCDYFMAGQTPLRSLEVSPAITQMVQETAQRKLNSLVNKGMGIQGLGAEGTAARLLYEMQGGYTELYCLVTAAEVSAGQSIDTIFWNVPISFRLDTADWEAYELYEPVFEMVSANSDFTADFLFCCVCYGAAISDAISQGLTGSMESFLSNADSWQREYESSPEYDSDTWANQWSDVIYERNEYETVDGGTIKVSTAYDSVYQNGDQIYMGPDGLSPEGWTKLEETY